MNIKSYDMASSKADLDRARNSKNDEFYTLIEDIEKEINVYLAFNPNLLQGKTVLCPCDDYNRSNFCNYFKDNFDKFGLRKLIVTSYNPKANSEGNSLFDNQERGKIFTKTQFEEVVDDLQYNGDFRSHEITKLRDEADFVFTNPPFSLLKEFFAWVLKGKVSFAFLGNINAITYKETFPFFLRKECWVGKTNFNYGMYFIVDDNFVFPENYNFKREINGKRVHRVASICWFTNIDYEDRHKLLPTHTTEWNLKNSSHKELLEHGYQKYDNYNAINIGYVDSIPNDFEGAMGVPITFIHRYNPNQFDIINPGTVKKENPNDNVIISPGSDGWHINKKRLYARIFIKNKK